MNRLENPAYSRAAGDAKFTISRLRSSRVRGLPMQPSDRWFVAVLRQICALKGMGRWSQSARTSDKIARIGTGTRGGDDETECGLPPDLRPRNHPRLARARPGDRF